MRRTKNVFKVQLILFTILLLLWNIFTPVLEGADESGHFCHADYISHHNKLPNLKINDGCFLWHPPLYYLSLAPPVRIFGLEEFSSSYFQINPKFNLLRKGEYAQFVHKKDELLFNWDAKIILIHLERLLSSFSGILIFFLTWKLSKKIFKKGPLQNASLILFFNPMFIHIFTTLTNVTLLSLITTSIIYLDLSFLKKQRPLKFYGALGLLFGLGFLSKNSIINLIPPVLASFWFSSRKFNNKINYILLCALSFMGTFIVTAGWYIYRSTQLYGSVLEFSVLKSLPGEHYHENLLEKIGIVNYINSFFMTIFKTFWSGFGALTVNFPDLVNVILLILVELVIVVIYVRAKRMSIYLKFCVLYIVFAFVLLFMENFQFSAMHAKDLFIVYSPLAILFGFGLFSLSDIKKVVHNKLLSFALIVLPVYFFSQSEIVRIVKSLISFTGITGSQFTNDYLSFFIKTLITVGIFYLLIKLLRKFQLTSKSVKSMSAALFTIDIIILYITTYFFYFKFI